MGGSECQDKPGDSVQGARQDQDLRQQPCNGSGVTVMKGWASAREKRVGKARKGRPLQVLGGDEGKEDSMVL